MFSPGIALLYWPEDPKELSWYSLYVELIHRTNKDQLFGGELLEDNLTKLV